MANFRRDNALPPFNVFIDGAPYIAEPYQTYCPEAVMQCGQAPFTFDWRVSSNGFNFITISNAESFCDFIGESGTTKYYELTVTDATGAVRTSFTTVTAYDFGLPFIANDPSEKFNAHLDKIIFPNPAADKISLNFAFEQDDTYTVSLSDLNGKIVRLIKKDNPFKGSTQNLELNVSDLPNGMYFVKIAGNIEYFTEKIVINH
ncbi:MAG: T9SS type A sorting domain-containing protein [Saprospiraceae bacterium]|nr:T9SS type A sorting domain-containing protein [Saprospiraceae bacterium]